jgi:hypothetical protein
VEQNLRPSGYREWGLHI